MINTLTGFNIKTTTEKNRSNRQTWNKIKLYESTSFGVCLFIRYSSARFSTIANPEPILSL